MGLTSFLPRARNIVENKSERDGLVEQKLLLSLSCLFKTSYRFSKKSPPVNLMLMI